MSVLPRKRAIKQFGSPAVFNTMSKGHTVYSSCLHFINMYGVINAKNCLLSATAKYVNASSIITNLPIPPWEKGKECTLYNSNYRSAAFNGMSMSNLMFLEVATACTVATA